MCNLQQEEQEKNEDKEIPFILTDPYSGWSNSSKHFLHPEGQ